jgi:uncharacterized protein
MGRLVVLILIVVLAVWLIRRALRSSATGPAQKEGAVQQELVACARCGMHLPRAEARAAGGRMYCGEEHARLGPDPGAHGG